MARTDDRGSAIEANRLGNAVAFMATSIPHSRCGDGVVRRISRHSSSPMKPDARHRFHQTKVSSRPSYQTNAIKALDAIGSVVAPIASSTSLLHLLSAIEGARVSAHRQQCAAVRNESDRARL